MKQKVIKIGSIKIANNLPLTLIAGPCQLESEAHAFMMMDKINKISKKLKFNFIYKTSFDKANRTSLKGKRGLGFNKSLAIFEKLKKKFNVPILTDVHTAEQCHVISKYVDVLQIPAFLCRQTDLLIAAAKTGKVINVKKGQFLAPWDMKNVVAKIESQNNRKILITERGVSFGYNTLVNDFRAIPILKEMGYPVIFDATHSVQQPGGKGTSSSGQREFIEPLSKAAVAIGVAAVFIETHNNPNQAPSDGPNMLNINNLESLLKKLKKIDLIVKK
jgi:2-dehydro-3-deoxyphosphooctonate aldolase (KDO 8-P synthase)